MAGGAVGTACRELAERIAHIGAHLLQAPVDAVRVGGGMVSGPAGSVPIAEVARTWYLRPQDLPSDVAAGGLEVTAGYKPLRDSGTFSYAAHAAVVSVDTELGDIRILDYAICEDGGTLINPTIVDGQVIGGTAQGIGTALYEEMPYRRVGPAAWLHARRLSAAWRDRSARRRASSICRRHRRYRCSARKASARAARSVRRPRSPMR